MALERALMSFKNLPKPAPYGTLNQVLSPARLNCTLMEQQYGYPSASPRGERARGGWVGGAPAHRHLARAAGWRWDGWLVRPPTASHLARAAGLRWDGWLVRPPTATSRARRAGGGMAGRSAHPPPPRARGGPAVGWLPGPPTHRHLARAAGRRWDGWPVRPPTVTSCARRAGGGVEHLTPLLPLRERATPRNMRRYRKMF